MWGRAGARVPFSDGLGRSRLPICPFQSCFFVSSILVKVSSEGDSGLITALADRRLALSASAIVVSL